MKKFTCLLWGLWFSMAVKAQGVFSNQTNITLKKVIEDYRLNSRKNFSWDHELFSSPDFEKAKIRFSELYQQIHNTIIKVQGEKPVILNGLFEMPDKDKKQNVIYFNFLPATGMVQKLKVELVLRQVQDKWSIVLMVYEPVEVDYKLMSFNLH
jgi:hypothetical protein